MDQVTGTMIPELLWDWGTAYEMFSSLDVLHNPSKFGLRGAWAAGVRSRLPSGARDILDHACEQVSVPLHWIHQLPDPKDGSTVLYYLKQIPAKDRLPTLAICDCDHSDYARVLKEVAERGSWDEGVRSELQGALREKKSKISPRKLESTLELWANSEEFGEKYFKAMRSYQEVFFAEEEVRIQPALERSLENAKKMAAEMTLPELLEDLSRGVTFDELAPVNELVLVPSFWLTPLIFYGNVTDDRRLLLFGARSPEDSLVPGEIVPDDLLLALKALNDPTRLRILRYLMKEQLSPAELARRLRLRPPTVTHHLHALRLAGMIRMSVKGKLDRRYSARFESVTAAYTTLKNFLEKDIAEAESAELIERGRVW
jgi:DNA-binding transcriptional ArsR family regulator